MIRIIRVLLTAGSDKLPVFLFQKQTDYGGFDNGKHKWFFNKFDSRGI